MSKKLLLVINPRAGRAVIKQHFWDIMNILSKGGYTVTTRLTKSAGDATRYTARHAGEYDAVVCCGGDGTLNETVNGLVKVENAPVLGYITAGTTNDVGYSLGLPAGMTDSAKAFCAGHPSAWDLGRFCADRYFCYVAAFGLFTDVTYETSQDAKNIWGRSAYIMEGSKRLGAPIKEYHAVIDCDGEKIEGNYILGMVTNSKSVGGFRTIYGTLPVLDDGLFEVALIKAPKTPGDLQHVISIMLQLESADSVKADFIQILQGRHFTFEFDSDIAWTLDGEFGGNVRVADISVENSRLSIMEGEKSYSSKAEKNISAK